VPALGISVICHFLRKRPYAFQDEITQPMADKDERKVKKLLTCEPNTIMRFRKRTPICREIMQSKRRPPRSKRSKQEKVDSLRLYSKSRIRHPGISAAKLSFNHFQ
jgi:hypothetical protein